MQQLECIIRGRVQGVLYRDFARRTAKRLGVAGYVENVPDGTVRVAAQAEEAVLKQFVAELKGGSMFSRVDEVIETWSEPAETFSDFTIRYSSFFDRL